MESVLTNLNNPTTIAFLVLAGIGIMLPQLKPLLSKLKDYFPGNTSDIDPVLQADQLGSYFSGKGDEEGTMYVTSILNHLSKVKGDNLLEECESNKEASE